MIEEFCRCCQSANCRSGWPDEIRGVTDPAAISLYLRGRGAEHWAIGSEVYPGPISSMTALRVHVRTEDQARAVWYFLAPGAPVSVDGRYKVRSASAAPVEGCLTGARDTWSTVTVLWTADDTDND